MEEQLESLMDVIIAEVLKSRPGVPATGCGVLESRGVENYDRRYCAVVGGQGPFE